MAQNLTEIGRLPNLDVKMDKNAYKNEIHTECREGWHLCSYNDGKIHKLAAEADISIAA